MHVQQVHVVMVAIVYQPLDPAQNIYVNVHHASLVDSALKVKTHHLSPGFSLSRQAS